MKINKPICLIEAFAGIGSQAMALRDLGANFEYCRVIEFDKYAINSYNSIHGTQFETTDITSVSGGALLLDKDKYTYLLTYSFPCQDISVAGKGKGYAKGDNTRSGLLWEVERILNEMDELPDILLMENVKQVHGKRHLENFEKWISFLDSKGYDSKWFDLNAKDYGVAQNRERCFMISVLKDSMGHNDFEIPEPINLRYVMKDYLEEEVADKYYVNSDRASSLISQLVENGSIPDPDSVERERVTVDYSLKKPKRKNVANCISTRDRGIDSRQSVANGVCE